MLHGGEANAPQNFPDCICASRGSHTASSVKSPATPFAMSTSTHSKPRPLRQGASDQLRSAGPQNNNSITSRGGTTSAAAIATVAQVAVSKEDGNAATRAGAPSPDASLQMLAGWTTSSTASHLPLLPPLPFELLAGEPPTLGPVQGVAPSAG